VDRKKGSYSGASSLDAARATALAEMGRSDEAAKAAAEFIAHAPELTVERHVKNFRWKSPADISHYRDGLTRPGVPMK
jgi:adenylate cyclase